MTIGGTIGWKRREDYDDIASECNERMLCSEEEKRARNVLNRKRSCMGRAIWFEKRLPIESFSNKLDCRTLFLSNILALTAKFAIYRNLGKRQSSLDTWWSPTKLNRFENEIKKHILQ